MHEINSYVYHSNTYVHDMAHRDEPEIVTEERPTSTGIW